MIPKGYARVDVVADSYFKISIKSNGRNKRGRSEKVIIASKQSKIQRDFHTFLLNGENKSRMIQLMFQTMQSNRAQTLNILRCIELVFDNCTKLTLSSCTTLEDYQRTALS